MKNKRRLIDANEVDPRSLAFLIHADGSEFSPYERGYNDAVISCYGLLTNAPTVDAAEVVRCEECKYWTEGRQHTGRCKALTDFHDAERYITAAEHFCSYGERKVNE